ALVASATTVGAWCQPESATCRSISTRVWRSNSDTAPSWQFPRPDPSPGTSTPPGKLLRRPPPLLLGSTPTAARRASLPVPSIARRAKSIIGVVVLLVLGLSVLGSLVRL